MMEQTASVSLMETCYDDCLFNKERTLLPCIRKIWQFEKCFHILKPVTLSNYQCFSGPPLHAGYGVKTPMWLWVCHSLATGPSIRI